MTTSMIHKMIAEIAHVGRQRIAEAERAAAAQEQARIEAERQRVAELWAEPMEQMRAALPEWMHPFLRHAPDVEPTTFIMSPYDTLGGGSTYHNPALLELPGLAPIQVYAYRDAVYFDVPTPRAAFNEFDDEWYVKWSRLRAERHDITQMGKDIAVAVALAQDATAQLTKVEEEVCWRNAEQTPAQDVA